MYSFRQIPSFTALGQNWCTKFVLHVKITFKLVGVLGIGMGGGGGASVGPGPRDPLCGGPNFHALCGRGHGLTAIHYQCPLMTKHLSICPMLYYLEGHYYVLLGYRYFRGYFFQVPMLVLEMLKKF